MAALPEVFWLPVAFTPGRSMFAEPSKATPPIFFVAASLVAVAELPVHPVALPVTLPVNEALMVPAEKSPLLSLNTIVLPVLILVALDVTVKVAPSAPAEPDNPLPDTAPAAT